LSVFAAAGGVAEVFSLTTESTDLAFVIRCSYRPSPDGGSDSVSFHFADRFRARRALIACSSRRAATPRKLPSRTTAITPGMRFTAASSKDTSWAPGEAGRTMRPNTMPGRRTSWT